MNARADFAAPFAAAAPVRIAGINEDLPPGEQVLWQGGPDWRLLARRALHVRKVAIYFALLFGWRAASALADGASAAEAVLGAGALLATAAGALALLAAIAWLSARTTIYAITNRRVAMRIGIALPIYVNLPFRGIETAALGAGGAARGDISLRLAGDVRLAWLHLWPHVRPWHLARPQPTLRALRDAPAVAAILAAALAADAAAESPWTQEATSTRTRSGNDAHLPGDGAHLPSGHDAPQAAAA